MQSILGTFNALFRIAAPGTVLPAEAIDRPARIRRNLGEFYAGGGRYARAQAFSATSQSTQQLPTGTTGSLAGVEQAIATGKVPVRAFPRHNGQQEVVVLANFSPCPQKVDPQHLRAHGLTEAAIDKIGANEDQGQSVISGCAAMTGHGPAVRRLHGGRPACPMCAAASVVGHAPSAMPYAEQALTHEPPRMDPKQPSQLLRPVLHVLLQP